MALPVLANDKPMYEVVVPSSQETFKFRPFLVKEQKSLLVAFESQDNKQILNAMLNCIESCVPGVDLKKLATFDLDYLFTQIRAKSVGEISTVLSACTKCNEENEVNYVEEKEDPMKSGGGSFIKKIEADDGRINK